MKKSLTTLLALSLTACMPSESQSAPQPPA
ncbi:hypothetical protein J2T37_002213 [Neisseria perflava]|nr:hypothetical protein [Neisseria perflava]MCP1773271.1 hypothetical protein [Neisseria perflava]